MEQRPNILLIMADQQRYDCVGYSGDYPVKTPNIDRLASEGMWFSRAYTPIPLCCPARQSLLNGRRPEAFGALWNYDSGLKISALDPADYAWPRDLSNRDYSTGYIGKWHVNPHYNPTAYGFEEFISLSQYEAFRERKYPDSKHTSRWLGGVDDVPVEDSETHWLADKAIQKIREYSQRNRPWHLRLDFPQPHLPCIPAYPFAQMYTPKDIPRWRSFEEDFEGKPYIQKQQLHNWRVEDYGWTDWAPIVARYYGVISQLDSAVGHVLDTLDRLDVDDDTLVIYTSDHGDMCGGHRMMDKHYVLYEDVVRVPLIIRWPGEVKPGLTSDEFVYNMLDLPPTVLEFSGAEPESFFHGRSLLPLIGGGNVPDWRTEVIATYNGQQFGLFTQRMLRDERWKYVWNTTDVDELYDMEEDPNELVNLAHEPRCTAELKRLRKKLYLGLLREEDTLVANPWIREQLLNNRKL